MISKPLLVVLPDVTTIQMAIRNGLPNEVENLLGPMSEIEAIDCLTSTYGLGKIEPDDDGLFESTTPILHAARSVKIEVFLSVLGTMRARLGLQQVMYAIDLKKVHERKIILLPVMTSIRRCAFLNSSQYHKCMY